MVSRSARSGMKGSKIPMPRSNPSMMTYIIRPKAMMMIHVRGRSMPMSLALNPRRDTAGSCKDRQRPGWAQRLIRVARTGINLSRCFRSLRDQLQHEADTGTEYGAVHDDKEDQSRRE